MKKLVFILLICIVAYPIAGIVSSCAEESDCSMEGRATLRCDIKTKIDGVVANDTLDSLTITAMGTDSIILNNQKKVTVVYLPLQYTVDSTTFVFQYNRIRRDTIIIRHSNTSFFVSMECGYDMLQAMISKPEYTRHTLDSLHVFANNTTTNETKNIELYYPY